MKSFDETYTDCDFQRHVENVLSGWAAQVASGSQPDLRVDGFRGSVFARLFGALLGRREPG